MSELAIGARGSALARVGARFRELPAWSLTAVLGLAYVIAAPATGLASDASTVAASAPTQWPRCASTIAPSASASPRSKGTRHDSSAIEAPTANHRPATRVARGAKRPSIAAANSAVATVIDTAASSCGPISAPSAGASTE